MRKEKEYDCVDMKNAAQAKLRSDLDGLSDEEARVLITRELNTSDGIVARKWRRMRERCSVRAD